jgi:ribosomal protein S18 acetylase RimI-like enzyme
MLANAAKRVAKPQRGSHVEQVLEATPGLTDALRRLLSVYYGQDRILEALQADGNSLAAYSSERLPGPGGALFTASSALRLEGALYLEPSMMESALLGHSMWIIQLLVLEPGAPEGTAEALLEQALSDLRPQADFLSARVPAADGAAIRGLHRTGFRAVSGEAVGVRIGLLPSPPRLPGVTLVPLTARHLEAAAEIARDCHIYSQDQGFDASRIGTYLARSLAAYVKDPFRAALAALDRSGELLGLVAFSKSTDLGEAVQRRVGMLDTLCVRPSTRFLGLGDHLQRHALARLAADSVEAVLARTLVHGAGSLERLKTLQMLGFTFPASNLLMHRWL